MSGWSYFAIGLGILFFCLGVQLFARAQHPLRGGVAEMLRGLLALLAVAVSGIWTGVVLPFSFAAAGFAAAAGIPGVIAMLLVKLILPA